MGRVRLGDRAAFGDLLTRHTPGLHAFLHRMIRNDADAEELTQEAFLRVWRHAERWQADRVRFSTWLYRIAHNLCIDRLRRRREVPLDELPDDRAAPARDIDGERQAARLRAFIEELPERQRTALVLCHQQGFSNQEAAQVLDVSVEALESLLSRARRTLRERMKPWITPEGDA